jgi:DNA polymerase epsilon subunit 1
LAYLANFKSTTIQYEDLTERSALLCYFVEQCGRWFKSLIRYDPYFYIACDPEQIDNMGSYLERHFEKRIAEVTPVEKIDLEQINHLSGKRAKFLRISFRTVSDLVFVRNQIRARLEVNLKKRRVVTYDLQELIENRERTYQDLLDAVTDLREYDVPYHGRVCIDRNVRVGLWYRLTYAEGFIASTEQVVEMKERPDLKYLAFDIETTK